MANRWKGNIIAASATTSSGTDFTGKANGSWSLNNQLQQKQANLWAKGQGLKAPDAPTSVTATIANAQSVISFTAPVYNGGSEITSYTVTSSPSGITATGSASPITITGLTNETAYTFTVQATNTFGISASSSPSNSVTPTAGPAIGQVLGGGYYGGLINVSGVNYRLIVAPKASGESGGKAFATTYATTGATSVINGPTNSAALAALGAAYQAAVFAEGLTIGGYSDWYLPAKNELEVLYYNLKPTTTDNNTSSGSNANAVSPEPISTNYTIGSPAQTLVGDFKINQTQAFSNNKYWSSTEFDSINAWRQNFDHGNQDAPTKIDVNFVRAIRRIAV
jgi:hypothetical protein